jgi:hypothetical protein
MRRARLSSGFAACSYCLWGAFVAAPFSGQAPRRVQSTLPSASRCCVIGSRGFCLGVAPPVSPPAILWGIERAGSLGASLRLSPHTHSLITTAALRWWRIDASGGITLTVQSRLRGAWRVPGGGALFRGGPHRPLVNYPLAVCASPPSSCALPPPRGKAAPHTRSPVTKGAITIPPPAPGDGRGGLVGRPPP